MRGILSRVIGDMVTSSLSNLTTSENTATPQSANWVVKELLGRSAVDEVAHYPVLQRSDSLILHGPLDISRFSFAPKFNIILHVPQSERMFSLFRTNVAEEAQDAFVLLKETLPVLINIDQVARIPPVFQVCEKSLLEKICASLRANPGWSAIHVAAAFDLHSYFLHSKMKSNINCQEGIQLKTPLFVAVEYKNVQSVKILLGLGAALDVTDIKDNNVIHQCANGSTEILVLLLNAAEEKLPMLKNMLNKEGCSPLHIACKNNNPDSVKALMNGGADVNIPFKESYPIHLAVKAKSACSVKEIVTGNPDQLKLRDLAEGGTPLHWATGHETIGFLLELGCDPNLVDNHGRTSLHLTARRGEVKSTLFLLCHQCQPDIQDEVGETALHIASKLCSKTIMQALVVFGANLNITNKQGFTPRHVLCTSGRPDSDQALFILDRVGAKRCPPDESLGCTRGCIFGGTFNGLSPANYPPLDTATLMDDCLASFSINTEVRRSTASSSVENQQQRSSKVPRQDSVESVVGGRVLCLDGGGIRGLVLTQMLLVIEEILGVPIVDVFDWVAGTSTGGILSLGLASGKSVLELQALYLRLKDKVFTGMRPYSGTLMEEFLKKEFGDKKMKDVLRPRVMVTSANAETRPPKFHFFRNYISPDSLLHQRVDDEPDLEEYVWQVAKWTGAAPSYFKLEGRHIDGGLVANNPTLDAITELVQFGAAMRSVGEFKLADIQLPRMVLSLGCGVQPEIPIDPQHLDIAWPRGVFDAISTLPRISTLVNLLVDQATQAEGQVVERSRAWCASIGVPFYRFSPPCPVFCDLDETRDEVLIDLMFITRAYVLSNKSLLASLKHDLFNRGPSQ